MRRAPLRSRMPRFQRTRERLALDVREDAVYWARARLRRRAGELLEWGCVPRGEPRELAGALDRLTRGVEAGALDVDVALRSPDTRLERVSLPRMSARDARDVGRRRSALLAAEGGEDAAHDFRLAFGREGSALWLCAARLATIEAERARWQALGVHPTRVTPHQLALAALCEALAPPADGELTAIFDLGTDTGSCVIADRRGWVFGRDVPLRFAGDPRVRSEAGEGMELESEVASLVRVERLAVELERTFNYVRTDGLGEVKHVILAGETEDIPVLAEILAAKLALPVERLSEVARDGPLSGIDPPAAVAVGLALARDTEAANLLPRDVRRASVSRGLQRRLSQAIGLAATLAVAVVVLGTVRVRWLEAELDLVRTRFETTAGLRERNRLHAEMRERALRVREVVESAEPFEPPFAALVETLGRVVPAGIALERVEASRGAEGWSATLNVTSQAPSLAQAARVVSDLRGTLDASPLLGVDAVERESSEPTADGGVRVRFRIQARLAVSTRDLLAAFPREAPRG